MVSQYQVMVQLATELGCLDEALELVHEFADGGDGGLEIPSEAMVNCLRRERCGLTEDEWDALAPDVQQRLRGGGKYD